MSVFSQNIKFLRKQKGLKQAEMQAQSGFSQSSWGNYEAGISMPRIDDLLKISRFLGYSINDLVETDLTKGNPILYEPSAELAQIGNLKSNPKGNLIAENGLSPPGQNEGLKALQSDVETLKQMLTMKDAIILAKDQLLETKEELIYALKAKIDGLLRENRAGGESSASAKNVA
jgi:transcriptional regulator with XRE-family HTH domain